MTTVPQLVYAPNCKEILCIYESTSIKSNIDLERRKLKILFAIYEVEHPNNAEEARLAKVREDAVGVLQIRPVAVTEANNISGYTKYYLSDRLDSLKSVEMFFTIQDFWNPDYNIYKAAMIWNGGPRWYKANSLQKKRLQYYWIKFKSKLG